jgi:hypothetical protein
METNLYHGFIKKIDGKKKVIFSLFATSLLVEKHLK